MMTPLEEALLALMMIFIMLGMGSSLTFRDFGTALRHPQAILIGFASQYLFMPLIAFTLAQALGLSPMLTVSLVLMGCVPGGTTSNIFAYFSRGDLGLSIMMTVCSTIAAVVMVPLVLGYYTADIAQEFRIPPENIAGVLFILLIPTLAGMWLRKASANLGALFELLGALLGLFVVLFLVMTWIPKNTGTLFSTSLSVYTAVVLLGLCGFMIGYWFARATGLNKTRARTVSLETGIQNGPLALLIVVVSITDESQSPMLLIPVMYSLFILLTSSLVTLYYRSRSFIEERQREHAKIEPA